MIAVLRSTLLLAAFVSLAACAAPPPAAPPAPAAPGSCDAKAAQFAVGQAYGEAIADEARRRSGARVSRALRPGQVVTLEYNSERLNLDLDAANRVIRVRCG